MAASTPAAVPAKPVSAVPVAAAADDTKPGTAAAPASKPLPANPTPRPPKLKAEPPARNNPPPILLNSPALAGPPATVGLMPPRTSLAIKTFSATSPAPPRTSLAIKTFSATSPAPPRPNKPKIPALPLPAKLPSVSKPPDNKPLPKTLPSPL